MDNAIFPNKFKAALAAHQVQIGCWCALANPISTEVLGLAGFDWLVLDAETRAKRRHHAHSAADGPER
ncbi:2-dehydro-3-deoxyglucarate aldolase [Klebsiella pneumoniae subsp. ozaenae]|uniref:2-dehydro-3-deoxyglucarate aldolase n=1 Tax=Klebsiella pneumoniae subsp. ozaenae TaxID=574 RepID=A0A378AGK8_KLEPO|nr:2-dehydro-3-deoxyglucarate aldolase [Klebsiella pneumoniae subsp. ozaenae]